MSAKKVRITINISPSEKQTLMSKASAVGLSLSSYIRMILIKKKGASQKEIPRQPERISSVKEEFMKDLQNALITDGKGFFNFQKLKAFKARYKL